MEDSSNANLRFAFITFRPAPGNPTLLTEFLTLFSPLINKAKYSASVIEEYGTPQAHFHAIVSGSFKDTDRMNRWFWNAKMKKFKESLQHTNTLSKCCFHNLLVKQNPDELFWYTSDVETCLGYVLKSEKEKDRYTIDTKGFTNDQILQADKMYFTSLKCKNRCDVLKNDWTLLTKKNAHCLIEDFCQKNDQTIRDGNLIKNMKRSRYSFVDLTSKAQKEIFDEIMISENKMSNEEEKNIDNEILAKHQDGQYVAPGGYIEEESYVLLKNEYNELIAKYNDLLKNTGNYKHTEIID